MNKSKDDEWRFTGFYGEPDTQNRHEAWARLKNLKSRGSAPWICAGDFNEITKQSEKRGGRIRPHGQIQAFREVLDECGFIDLGFMGSEFTWHKHFANYTVWECLDRAVATSDWLALFPDTKIYHLEADASDHRPLLIVPDGMNCSQQRPFRFEQMWLTEQGCSDTIQAVWQRDHGENEILKVIRKVDECGKELTKWSKNCFKNVRKDLEKTRKLLAKAELVAMNGGNNKRMKYLEKQILILLDREAKMWAQRSKVQWLRDGDKNTRFFHSKATQRRRRNYIKGLYDENGIWCTHPTRVTDTVVQFYQKLFTSCEPVGF